MIKTTPITSLLIALLTACGETTPTYFADAGPLLQENCVTCHTAGGIGPMALDSYRDAADWSGSIAAVVASGKMPPYYAVADGTCGTFHEPRTLPQDAIDTLVAWADAGAEEGTDDGTLAGIPPRALTQLNDPVTVATPDFTPEIQGGQYAQFDEYRCFELASPVDHDTFITGSDVTPGTDAIVHHVIAFVVDPATPSWSTGTNRQRIDTLSAQDDRDGWECFGAAGDGVAYRAQPVVWAPGQGAVRLPGDSGMAIGPDDIVVVQVHYNLSEPQNIGLSDSTTLAFETRDDVPNVGWTALADGFLPLIGTGRGLAPGLTDATYSWSARSGQLLTAGGFSWDTLSEAEIWAVMPHMHQRGRTLTMTANLSGTPTCGMQVDQWDFNWQLLYQYEEPLRLHAGDTIDVTCGYDTSDATSTVLPGWGTQNEMCLTSLYMVAPASARR